MWRKGVWRRSRITTPAAFLALLTSFPLQRPPSGIRSMLAPLSRGSLHAGTIPAPLLASGSPSQDARSHRRRTEARAGDEFIIHLNPSSQTARDPRYVPYRFSCKVKDGCTSTVYLMAHQRTLADGRGWTGLSPRTGLHRGMGQTSPSPALQAGQLGPTRDERPVTGPPRHARLSLVRARQNLASGSFGLLQHSRLGNCSVLSRNDRVYLS